MDSRCLIFDSASSHAVGNGSGHMIRLGTINPVFRARSVLAVVEDTGVKIHPFFTAPDDCFDEDYYDEQMPGKKRRLTPEQVHLLEGSFEEDNKLEPERKSELAQKLGLKPRQVAVWFQNRRARWKTKNLERDFDGLKASYDSLLADHEFLSKENERLRSQVLTLTQKLQAKEQTVSGVTEEKLNDQVGLNANLTAMNCQPKSEDGVSSGSGGSVVVDKDGHGQSYFPETDNCIGLIDGGVQSEDDFSDEGCSYYPEPMFAEPRQHDEDAQLEWWVWN